MFTLPEQLCFCFPGNRAPSVLWVSEDQGGSLGYWRGACWPVERLCAAMSVCLDEILTRELGGRREALVCVGEHMCPWSRGEARRSSVLFVCTW